MSQPMIPRRGQDQNTNIHTQIALTWHRSRMCAWLPVPFFVVQFRSDVIWSFSRFFVFLYCKIAFTCHGSDTLNTPYLDPNGMLFLLHIMNYFFGLMFSIAMNRIHTKYNIAGRNACHCICMKENETISDVRASGIIVLCCVVSPWA